MKILVVVDYQNDFVNGALGFEGAWRLDASIYSKVRDYIKSGNLVVFTLDTHESDYLSTREGRQLPIPHCIRKSQGWQLFGATGDLYEQIKDSNQVVTIQKSTFAVSPTSLIGHSLFNRRVGENEVTSIELCGLVTNMCVVSNAVAFQARFPNAQIVVWGSMVDSFDKELHKKTLDVLEGMQVKVIR